MSSEHEIQTRERLARHWGEAEASVQAFVFSAINRFHEAEEVVQQVALTVVRRFDEYDENRPFIAWALWLAKSRIADYYRARARGRRHVSDEVLDQIAQVLVQHLPERSARQEALETCIGKLSEKSQRMIRLRYLEEASMETVARSVGSTEGSVRVLLSRARKALAECIQGRIAREVRT
jgi:RNA polymerase sigma-70 factor (ECF subfamily)